MGMTDSHGFPGTDQNGLFDGGDTAAILGNCIALQKFDGDMFPSRMLSALVDPQGIPRRHPDTSKWYGQSDRCSRDQLIPLICAGIRLGNHPAIDMIYHSHHQRYCLTAWNTRGNGAMDMPKKFPDLTLFEVWALWIRYTKPWWAILVLWFLDIETLIGAIHWRFFREDRVTRNHMLVCKFGLRVIPSPTMWLADLFNNWEDLITRWEGHTHDTFEYPTAYLFRNRIY